MSPAFLLYSSDSTNAQFHMHLYPHGLSCRSQQECLQFSMDITVCQSAHVFHFIWCTWTNKKVMCSYKYSLRHSEILNIENLTPTNTQLYSIHDDDAL